MKRKNKVTNSGKTKAVKSESKVRYEDLMIRAIRDLDMSSLDKIVDFIWEAYKGGRTIFFAGNGGSASTASHLAADLGKNTARDHKDMLENRMRTVSMCDNMAWITSVSNDMSYDDIFVEQLKSYAKEGDILFIVSGSGNSMNIIKAAMWAKSNGLRSIGLLGFDGGYVKEFLERSLVVESSNYGIVESVHSYIHHFLVDALKTRKKGEAA